jgi:protease-4
MANASSLTKKIFSGLWSVLNFLRNAFFNIVFIFIIVGILIAASSQDDKIIVPSQSALVLNLSGDLVIQKTYVDPVDIAIAEASGRGEESPEVLLKDLIFTIENAALDNRIKVLVLNLDNFRSAGLDKLRQVGEALDNFKATGKSIYAVGDFYSRNQYYLASHANHIYLNPNGGVLLEGYGRFKHYYKSALEKLKITSHIFKVGTYKSAVEPILRDNMSPEAKEANEAWLGALWQQYKTDVAAARGISVANFDEKSDEVLRKFEISNNDFAQYAVDNKWVDALKTRNEIRRELIEVVGESTKYKGSYQYISYKNYLSVIQPSLPATNKSNNNVGVIVAKGTILDGNKSAGTIGGESTARLLRKARFDKSVKAVVLQVDSGGGSAFASEIINQEIEELKVAGKPVIASMSTYAASGGYWIAASADEIWASPSTVTGSIGIFASLFSVEDALDTLGIYYDGIGTTEFDGISPTAGFSDEFQQFMQRNIEHGYDQFLTHVAKGRGMTKEQVNDIAQGRVWIGETAKEIGLVDKLGDLDDAVQAAAKLADLEDFDVKYVEPTLSPQEQLIKDLLGQSAGWVLKTFMGESANSPLLKLFTTVSKEVNEFAQLNDPQGKYVLCIECGDY